MLKKRIAAIPLKRIMKKIIAISIAILLTATSVQAGLLDWLRGIFTPQTDQVEPLTNYINECPVCKECDICKQCPDKSADIADLETQIKSLKLQLEEAQKPQIIIKEIPITQEIQCTDSQPRINQLNAEITYYKEITQTLNNEIRDLRLELQRKQNCP